MELRSLISQVGSVFQDTLIYWIIGPFLNDPQFAPGLALILISIALLIISHELLFRFIPSIYPIAGRLKFLNSLYKNTTCADQRQSIFSSEFAGKINPALMGTANRGGKLDWIPNPTGKGTERRLQQAWSEMKETFVSEIETPLRNTVRPHEYFYSVSKSPRYLTLLANTFVSVGLLLTFIGIVAVLMSAGCTLQYANGALLPTASEMCRTLLARDLLEITNPDDPSAGLKQIIIAASSKFYTSIGGLMAAILLRLSGSIFAFFQRHTLELLSNRIEEGLLFAPEQQIMLEQLKAFRDQTTEFKVFTTDLAVAIGEKFTEAMEPMNQSITAMTEQIVEASMEQLQAVQQGVGAAVDNAAGGEIRELGRVLASLREELGGLSGKMLEGSEAAAQQISEAASQLSTVGGDIRNQFLEISDRLKDTGTQLGSDMKAISVSTQGTLDTAVSSMTNAAERNAEIIGRTAESFEGIAANVATHAQEAMRLALDSAGEATKQAATSAAEEFGSIFQKVSGQWTASVDGVLSDLKHMGRTFQNSSEVLGEQINQLTEASKATSNASMNLTDASQSLRDATTPVREAIEQLGEVSGDIGREISRLTETADVVMNRATGLAKSMEETHSAAEKAWSDYQTRFENVDDQLALVLNQMSEALKSNSENMQTFAAELDGELSKVVTTFAQAVSPLSEAADHIEEVVDRLRKMDQTSSESE